MSESFFEEKRVKETSSADVRSFVLSLLPRLSLAYISVYVLFVQLLFVLSEHKFHSSWLES